MKEKIVLYGGINRTNFETNLMKEREIEREGSFFFWGVLGSVRLLSSKWKLIQDVKNVYADPRSQNPPPLSGGSDILEGFANFLPQSSEVK